MQGQLDSYWAKIGKTWATDNVVKEKKGGRSIRRLQVAKFMANTVAHIDKPRILEVGCNYGENLANIKNCLPEANLFGVDISKDAIDLAKERNPGPQYNNASVYDLPYEPLSFDLVFTMGVMIHLHPSEIKHAVGSIAKLSVLNIVHTEVATKEYYAKCSKFSSKNKAFGPRRPYLFLHDYKRLYERTHFTFVEQVPTIDGLITLHFKK